MTPPRIAANPADLPDRATMLSRPGIELMQDMLAGRIAAPAMAATMNITLQAVEPGRVVFRGTPLFAHTNPMGAVHGGWYGSILDSALGCAVMTAVPAGKWYTTLEYKVNLTRALPVGMAAEAVATLVHAGRTTAVAEARLCGLEDGKVYATGSTTCLILAG